MDINGYELEAAALGLYPLEVHSYQFPVPLPAKTRLELQSAVL